MRNIYLKAMALCTVFLLFAGSIALAQQKITIKGKVTDAQSHSGIPGVSILDATLKKAIAITDQNGNYSVSIESDRSLLFRFIGYEDKTVKANKAEINLTMAPAEKYLKESVIVGYTTRSKGSVTGAVSMIDKKDIQDVPVANLEQLLQGKVAGMNIQNISGAPGFGGSINIRGISQLNVTGSGDEAFLSSSNPLLVIDNVPIDYDGGIDQSMLQPGAATGPLALLPPEDIESIEVFKDAQAASLYGSRGANGVIVITTRRGNSAVPIINFNNSIFLNTPPKLRPVWGGNLERDFRTFTILNYSEYDFLAKIQLATAQFITDSLNGFYNNSTDWQGLFYQKTINSNNNLQISGGNAKMNYKANLAYQMNQGIIKNTGFNKYTANMQLNLQPNDRLRISGQLFGALGQKQRGNGGGLTGNGAGNAFSSSLLPGPSHFLEFPELRAYLENVDDNNTVNIRSYLSVEYEVLKGLRLTSATSYDYYTDTRDRFNQAFSNNNQTMIYGFVSRRGELNTRNGLVYNFTTNPENSEKAHNLLVSVFTEANIKEREDHIRDMRNGPSDFYWGPRGYSPRFYPGNPWNNATGHNVNGTHESATFHALSYAGVISYNFRTKYNLDLSYRADGNSNSGTQSRYSINPSIGVRYNFTKESIFQDLNFIDYGSIRASYGINSRPASTRVNSLGYYSIYSDYNNNPAIGPDWGIMPNPYLQSEKAFQYNFGFDASVLKGKLSVTYDTYFKKSYNILQDQFLSDVSAYNRIQVNGGAIVNYGHEMVISARPFTSAKAGGFQWNVSVNGAIARSVITELPAGIQMSRYNDGGPFYIDLARKVGRNPMSNYIYQTEGIYQYNSEVPVDPIRGVRYKTGRGNGTTYFQAGDPQWRDVNGDYFLDDRDDNMISGNPEPLIVGGLSNTWSYKNFSLNIYASYLAKRTIMNTAMTARLMKLTQPANIEYSGELGGSVNIYDLDKIDYWKNPGDKAKYPNIYYVWRNGQIQPFRADQTLWEEDGSYFKINQITLGYTFRDFAFMKKAKLRSLRAYATAFNVAIFSNYSGPNPENVSQLGRDNINGYPSARSYTAGFTAEF
ncbi:SusC/RagA family TonB-linked outer membrane protein [Chitinophaga deserti]|uniref:SusC/RagA family TonB-linked outer membrane protein n=1 Tax=Chitinophaga deserti TaxID=2164099 RepID=UPI000D6AC249|nr:SusC/RagA family TonB-linked outer membrane protein [Chitinophaga deserti]